MSPARTMPAARLALGLRVLAELLEAGLPLSRTLAALGELAPSEWRVAIPVIRESVRQGKSLASALESSPVAFPPLIIGVVRAGEAGSGLAAAVRRAAEYTDEAAAARASIRGALAYPLVLAAAGLASVAFLTGVALPRFAVILGELGQQLPPTTRLLLDVSVAARAGAPPALIVAVVCAVLWRAWISTEDGRARWHDFLLGLPVVGAARQSAATARSCAALSALLASGVPIARALAYGALVSADAAQRTRVLHARERVLRGERPSVALAGERAMTPTAIHLIRAGEESGRLAAMLSHAARLESEQTVVRTRTLARILEPALVMFFGAIVALVAAALLQALYSVRPGP